ncbi:MAG: hypothetical protein Tsb0018_01750 [Opitutales bacterium]
MDTEARSHFIKNIGHNYSVIAPAGVGKTQSMVERIAHFVRQVQPHDPASVPQLVVVTYTRKAASEIKERVHRELMADSAGHIQSVLEHAFFGTTHSFCLNLLQEWGHLMGLPTKLEALEPGKEEAFFSQFIQQTPDLTSLLPQSIRKRFFPCIDFWKLVSKASALTNNAQETPVEYRESLLQLDPIWNYIPETKATSRKIEASKAELASWLDNFKANKPSIGLPESYTGSDEAFQELWQMTLRPFYNWISSNAVVWLKRVQQAYLDHKLSLGFVAYDDMIALGARLLEHPSSSTAIQSQRYHIVLDEAQDASHAQFKVLLGVLGLDMDNLVASKVLPRGQFCMVGDPQQAIYGSGKDLPTYLKLHKRLDELGWAKSLYFRTTYRCSQNIVAAVNTLFPQILTEQGGRQAKFETMHACDHAVAGKVSKLVLNAIDSSGTVQEKSASEAQALAVWLKDKTPASLGAHAWDGVALLCPRNDWIPALVNALEKVGIPCQAHMRNQTLGGNPTYAWISALLTLMHEPWNSFELVGVLREIWGIRDGDIADYVATHYKNAQGLHPLNIIKPPAGEATALEQALAFLANLRLEARKRSLYDFFNYMLQAIDLPSRLAGLTDYSLDALLLTLGELRAQAIQAEESGEDLASFARSLVSYFDQSCDDVGPKKDHLQLLSCHNAKGLEWDVVMVPFMHRTIAFANPSYPHYFDLNSQEAPSFIMNSSVWTQEQKALRDQTRRYELERLLYVTLTRPKRHLILVDDRAFEFDDRNSLADLLHVPPGKTHAAYWDALPSPEDFEGVVSNPIPSEVPEKATISFDWDTARNLANACLERITPSSLAQHDSIAKESTPASLSSHAGTRYGDFWHAMMEDAPWGAGRAACWDYFKTQPHLAPNVDRANKELDAFLTTELAASLMDDAWRVHCEVPFLWRADDTQCYEGFMDLVAHHVKTGEWRVIDWKTDTISPETASSLVEKYKPQLKIYEQALASMMGDVLSVEAILYSTTLGEALSLS